MDKHGASKEARAYTDRRHVVRIVRDRLREHDGRANYFI